MAKKRPRGEHRDMGERLSRRKFMAQTGAFLSVGALGLPLQLTSMEKERKTGPGIRIDQVNTNFEREDLFPYRFKGSMVTQLWQAVVRLQSSSGVSKIGLGTQNVLWSDADVAGKHSENGANALMFAVTERATQMVKGISFTDPMALQDAIFPELFAYAKKITGNPDLRKTFVLNALVPVDNAAWLLYAHENKIRSFDEMIPTAYREGLSHKHEKVASIPSFPVGTDIEKIKSAADKGYFIMKLKTGSRGTQKEMLEKDMAFLTTVHKAIGHYRTSYTKDGKIPYYLDPNGRYKSKDTLLRFLEHARNIGAFDQIAIIEEPFGENNESYVGDLGVPVAADESAHNVEDALKRMEQGYSTIVVKAIAKTLSMTLRIIRACHERNTPCFSADLTVNPILVDWNKSVAARLAPLPNVQIGLLETNGHQYYKEWDRLTSYHPKKDADWTTSHKGVYRTGKSFYEDNGGIFLPSVHYENIFT